MDSDNDEDINEDENILPSSDDSDEESEKDDNDEESEESESEDVSRVEEVKTNNIETKMSGLFMTTDVINPSEYTNLVGFRAQDISKGSPSTIDWKTLELTDAIDIAAEELKQRKFPYLLRRPIGVLKGGIMEFELVNPNELDLPIGMP
jgi:DNA-directed RNA polymerase subunit K/omega